MKVSIEKFTERDMDYFWLRLSDGRKTYCRSITGEFDKRTQSAARGVIDAIYHIRPSSIKFDLD